MTMESSIAPAPQLTSQLQDQLPKDPIKLTGETVLMSNASDGKLCTDTFRSESDVCHEYPVPTADGEEV